MVSVGCSYCIWLVWVVVTVYGQCRLLLRCDETHSVSDCCCLCTDICIPAKKSSLRVFQLPLLLVLVFSIDSLYSHLSTFVTSQPRFHLFLLFLAFHPSKLQFISPRLQTQRSGNFPNHGVYRENKASFKSSSDVRQHITVFCLIYSLIAVRCRTRTVLSLKDVCEFRTHFSRSSFAERGQRFLYIMGHPSTASGLVVRVSGCRYRGSGFDPRRYQIF